MGVRNCVECGKPLTDGVDRGKSHFHCVTGGAISQAYSLMTLLDFYAVGALAGRMARVGEQTVDTERVADEVFRTAFAMVKKRQEIWRVFDPPADAQKP